MTVDRDDCEPVDWTVLMPDGVREVRAPHAWISDSGGLIVGDVDGDGRSWQPVLLVAPRHWVTCAPSPPPIPGWQT